MKKYIFLSLLTVLCLACGTQVKVSETISEGEKSLINDSSSVMRVLTISNKEDSLFLRQGCVAFNVLDINTPEYHTLAQKMVETLKSQGNNGMCIAGPQIGIHRNIIAVKRLDKEGEPIEVYANPYIVETNGEQIIGMEKCLSVPDTKNDTKRFTHITIGYTDPHSDRIDNPRTLFEEVSGSTAILFQHAIDHLEGLIFTDFNNQK